MIRKKVLTSEKNFSNKKTAKKEDEKPSRPYFRKSAQKNEPSFYQVCDQMHKCGVCNFFIGNYEDLLQKKFETGLTHFKDVAPSKSFKTLPPYPLEKKK